jgi:hypothetical protein
MRNWNHALGLAFAAVVAVGYGCNSSDSSTPPQSFSLDGMTYTEKYTCNETFTGGPPYSCPDLNATDVINFQSTGSNHYVGHDVPDTGFVYNGDLVGTVFTWSATSPDGYTESGTWTFTSNGDSFAGSSDYVADPPGAYSGHCNTTGTVGDMSTPPDPPAPTGC